MKRLLVRNGNDAKANVAELNFQNRTLYHGDNLDFLRGMNSNTIHLIATDPPFNKNRDFHATPDSLAKGARFSDRWSWDRDVHEEWTDSIIDDWPAVWEIIIAARAAYGDDMGAFLCWLGVRLMEMHRVLRSDGSIYLHCDSTASHYIKGMMDAIFGWENFRNEVVWLRDPAGKGGKRISRQWPRNYDSILLYSKSNDHFFAQQYTSLNESQKQPYRYKDENGYYKAVQRGNYSDKSMEKFRAEGRIHTSAKGKEYIKYYLKDAKSTLGSVWTDIYGFGTKTASKERTGYPTQKPLDLYERIIKASSNEGDFVLDPFCGCATTPIAAERLKRQWIGMDIWDGALEQVQNRLVRDTILRFDDQRHHVTLPKVHYETKAPVRTDDNEIAAPTLKLRIRRPVEAWEKISHRGMVNILAQAQRTIDGIICGGCGRVLEREFMELDHITPKKDRGANHILNRILLCRPCNRRKRENLTLSGLLRENKKADWMRDEKLAKRAQNRATDKAEWARDHFHTEECQALIAGNYPDSAI